MNRRELIQRVLLGTTVLVVVPSILESCTKVPSTGPGDVTPGTKLELDLSLAANSALNNTGGSLIVQNVIVINTGSGNFKALSNICTHQGCTVSYDAPSGYVKCPCHNSVFTTSGSVVAGPAPSSLASYVTSKSGNILTITF
jgi:cytochrome b6-f complex iron-sulfur subunit